jgi:hypothetical protein
VIDEETSGFADLDPSWRFIPAWLSDRSLPCSVCLRCRDLVARSDFEIEVYEDAVNTKGFPAPTRKPSLHTKGKTITMILLQMPGRHQPKTINDQERLEMQNELFFTLNEALRRLDPDLHRFFLVKSLHVVLQVPGLDALPTISLAELLFALLESCDDCNQMLDLQNVMIFASQILQLGGANCATS